MTYDEKKLIRYLIKTYPHDSHVDTGVPQQNRALLYPEEIDPIISSEHQIDKKYYTKIDDGDFLRGSNLQHTVPLEEIVQLLFNIGISAHTVGEFLEQAYGNVSEKEGSIPKKLFIASSFEGMVYATALKKLLSERFLEQKLNISCMLWCDRGVFLNGESTLANLERIANELYADGNQKRMGYAACVLTPDETVTMRKKEYSVARDNVLFEYGLFLGKLGHARTFLLIPPEELSGDQPKFHTLSDLKGITSQFYQSYEKNANPVQAEDALRKVAERIFYDISEREKKLSSQETNDSASDST